MDQSASPAPALQSVMSAHAHVLSSLVISNNAGARHQCQHCKVLLSTRDETISGSYGLALYLETVHFASKVDSQPC